MLLETLCVAMLLAVGDGAGAASGGEAAAVAKEVCPCRGGGDCRKGECGSASACGAACSKTIAAVEKTCDDCEKTLAAVDQACATCAKVLAVWEKVAAEDEPCCSGCSKCCAAAAKVAGKCCDEARVSDAAVVPASAVALDAAVSAQVLLRQKLAQRDELQREIDELSAVTESWQQIVVRVKVLEVNLTKMQKLGVDYARFDSVVTGFGTSLTSTSVGSEAYSNPAAASGSYEHPPCGTGKCQKPATSFWDTLEENNLARVIAEPTLVAVSGRPASFSVGGELPIPAGAGSAGACQFLSVGTKLDVLALSLGDNKVRLEVRPRISEVSNERAMVADENGNKIPALRVTECDTACELEFGETAALTGLVQRRTVSTKTEKGVKEETEDVMLMVVVTPEAVGTRVAQRVSITK